MGAVLCGVLAGCQSGATPEGAVAKSDSFEVFEGPVERAVCGPGSIVETGLQGQVSLADRLSGRNEAGYQCNMELVSQFQGEGASWQFAWYEDCAYYGTYFGAGKGVQVIDASDPAHPQRTAQLVTPAMLDPWESLKVNERRGILAASAGWNIGGPVFMDVYDLKEDCANPKLLASLPAQFPIGHEGDFAPDGMTYYVGVAPSIVDMTDPALPTYIPSSDNQGSGHGLSLNTEGTRMYAVGASCGNGLKIIDMSQAQARVPNPATPVVGEVCWEDGSTAQHTIPIWYDDKPFVVFVDEGGLGGLKGPAGAARIIDISDETQPFVISKLKLEIHMPENADAQIADTEGNGIFGYQAHYCSVDRQQNPTALACGYFQSGIRVFDIRNPYRPSEIAYYNPPAQVGKEDVLVSSEHAHGLINTTANGGPIRISTDWCTSQPRFARERGELWAQCQDFGFMILKFTNNAWPLPDLPMADADAPADAAARDTSKFGGALGLWTTLLLCFGALRRRRAGISATT